MGSVSSSNSKAPIACRNFIDSYDIADEIGIGSFASVYKCYRRSDSGEYAVKIINKMYLTEKELIGLRDEIRILRRVSHKNIIKLIDVFDDGQTVFMVLELCDGHDLFDQLVERKKNQFTEKKAAEIIYTLSNTLQYLHKNMIVHRDLKPENILIGIDGTIKIADFGLASIDSVYMDTCCGTPHYVAPEIINQHQYTNKCDTWSLGVILYNMLGGYQPFNSNSLNGIYKLIIKGKYNFNSKRWDYISNDAKDLIECLLQIDPKKRYSAKNIKYHPWIIENVNKNMLK